MKSLLKTIFFVLICLGIGVGIGKAYITWRGPGGRGFEHSDGAAVVTGIGDAPAQRGFTVRADRLPSADNFKQWDDLYATTIGIPASLTLVQNAAAQKALVDAVKLAHARHYSVVLLPDDLGLAPSEHAPYSMGLLTAASLAQNAHMDYFCISALGREPDMAYWRGAISDVRGIYKGKIIFAAFPSAIARIDCWDLVDVIGVIGPIPVPRRLPDAPQDVTVHDLRVAWDCTLTTLDTLAREKGKTIALLNMNIPAEVSASLPAPDAAPVAPGRNPALQQLLYEALLLETKGRAQTTEVLLFNWSDDRDASSYSTPDKLPAVLAKIRDAWDPGKPRLPDALPLDPADDATEDAGDEMPGDNPQPAVETTTTMNADR